MPDTTDRTLWDIFPGTTQMAQTMRARDWSATPLGDPRLWPDALKIPLRMMLTSRFEMWLGWGDDLCFFYNDAYIPTLGLKHPAMLGRPFREVWKEVYDDVADQVERVRAGEASWNNALLLLLERNGYPEETYHSFSYSPLFSATGQVDGLLCVVSEETARVIGERRMETLRHLGAALGNARNPAAVHAAVDATFAGNKRDFPFAVLQLAGDNAGEALFRRAAATQGSGIDDGEAFDLAADVPWPTGDWSDPPTKAMAIAIHGQGDAPAGRLLVGLNPHRRDDRELLKILRLIAAQIEGALATIAALHVETRRADRIWSLSRDIIVVVDAQGVFRSVSPSWSRLLGHPVDAVVGRPFRDFMHPDDIEPSAAALARALESEELTDYENRFRAIDGRYHRIQWHTTLEDGLVYAYGRDVTERRQVEERLSESEEQFRHLVNGVTDYAICMLDLEGRVSAWNEGARRIKGYEPEEIIGEHFSRFYTEEDRARGEPDRALATAKQEGLFRAEGWRVRRDGNRFRASVVIGAIRDDGGRPIGYAKITRDVTEREQAERALEQAREALFQSQKMEAIGQLTGGIAHDFNNLLMAVLGSLELLGKRLSEDPLARRLLNNAIEGAQRGATLTQRMLAFARRQDLVVDRVDLPGLLMGMNDLVQRSIGPEWPISTRFPMKLPSVRADANQLEMALLNLIVNARDAMPAGGPILISTSCEDLDEGVISDLPAGSYVRLEVADRGAGMDPETLRRATEPFFTTKGVGKGTGLGLPMVHGMARQIGGTFELMSEPVAGTSAIIWLPAVSDPIVQAEAVPAVATVERAASLRILAVDDDALVLINTAALLEDLGHEVIEAGSGEEALALFRTAGEIDLLLTDHAMPGMTGTELIAAIDAERPGIPTIIASGYGEGVGVDDRAIVRLGKPFNQARLAQAIAEAIDLNPLK
ncbi:PAS domain S-box-containing protein [Sphingomonas zeicaulis]|uniref:PAS domain S-box protein n=1 Tax=Sphingomonas zeicaulis TaxID=1632740 RepID=UPI003D24EFCF